MLCEAATERNQFDPSSISWWLNASTKPYIQSPRFTSVKLFRASTLLFVLIYEYEACIAIYMCIHMYCCKYCMLYRFVCVFSSTHIASCSSSLAPYMKREKKTIREFLVCLCCCAREVSKRQRLRRPHRWRQQQKQRQRQQQQAPTTTIKCAVLCTR